MVEDKKLAELILRLRLNSDFTELMKFMDSHRNELLRNVVYGNVGTLEERKGMALAVDQMLLHFLHAPERFEKQRNRLKN